MGIDLGLILAVMGTVFVGNPLSLEPGFSIGGETGSVSNILSNGLDLLGNSPQDDMVSRIADQPFRKAARPQWVSQPY
jgi:hypothetical protein